MNVGQLRKAIAELPDDMPVLMMGEMGTDDDPNLYVIPAHIERSPYGTHIYDDHRSPSDWRDRMDAESGRSYQNCTALLLSAYGNDDGDDITPDRGQPSIIDGELVQRELT